VIGGEKSGEKWKARERAKMAGKPQDLSGLCFELGNTTITAI